MSCRWLDDDCLLTASRDAARTHLERCEDCRGRLDRYGKIAALIARGATSQRLPPGWAHRTLTRARTARRSRRRRIATLSILTGATAAALVVLIVCTDAPGTTLVPSLASPRLAPASPATASLPARAESAAPVRSDAPWLAVQIISHAGRRGDAHAGGTPGSPGPSTRLALPLISQAHPGDEVRVRAMLSGAAFFAIRVYRGSHAAAVACPDAGPAFCIEPDPAVLIWTFPAPGTYQVLLLASQRPIAPARGSLDDDVAVATPDGAQVISIETIEVR